MRTGIAPRPLEIDGARVVTFAGRFVPHKGYDLYVAAAELLKAKGVATTFQTIGDGPSKRESPAVHNLGWTDYPAPVLAASHVVVIPNRIGYYDLLPLEVASLGRPLVLSDAGGGADQLALLPDAISFAAAGNATHLAKSIEQAVSRSAEDESWGAANRLAYEAHFSMPVFAERWMNLIDRVLSDA